MPPVQKSEHTRAPTFMRQWRKFKKMTLEQVADRVEVDTSTVGRIERGEIPYNQDFLERVAFAYGCDVTDLLAVDPLKPDPPKLVFERIKAAPRDVQDRVWKVIDTLLKAG